MKNEINQKLNWSIIFPYLSIVFGAILLIYMITFEDEPGALPLILILTGVAFLIIHRFKNRNNTNKQV